MPLPNGYLPREGDVLVIHARVKFDVDPEDRGVHLAFAYQNLVIDLDKIVGIALRTWKPSEKVRHRNIDNLRGEVSAICGDKVWVKLAEGSRRMKPSPNGFLTVHCNELEPDGPPADTSPIPEPAPIIEPLSDGTEVRYE